MSIGSTADQSVAFTSPWFGTSGQWCARIRDGASSYSQNQAGLAPKNASTARSRPP